MFGSNTETHDQNGFCHVDYGGDGLDIYMTSSACTPLTALDSPSRPLLLALPETAMMLSTTLDTSQQHAGVVSDRKEGMLVVRAHASEDSFHTKRRMEDQAKRRNRVG